MDDGAPAPYDQRCQELAAQVRAFALTTFVTRLALGFILDLPGAIDLKALILLLLLRDLRAGGAMSQRWGLVLILLELFELITAVVVAIQVRRWGLSGLGSLDLTGPTAWILALLVLVFCLWSGWLAIRLAAILRSHPTTPPGRAFRWVVALVFVGSILLAPAQVWQTRQVLFTAWREERSTVATVDGQPVWERVLFIGPPEQERLALVVLMPVRGADPPAEIPNELRVLRTSEETVTLGPENATEDQQREVAIGSALWWDPERHQSHVLRDGLDREWLEHPDHLPMLLADGLPSRLAAEEAEQPPAADEDSQ